jgi:hypothetical protein
MKISISGRILHIDGRSFDLEYPIAEAFELDGRVIALFDPDAYTEKFGQFQNLIALKETGELLWKAELPTNDSGDRYYKIAERRPLVAYSIYSYNCEIDPATGKIKDRIFIK